MRERLQCFASERGKTGAEIVSPILDERKGGSIRVTIVPQKNSTEWTKTKITPWRYTEIDRHILWRTALQAASVDTIYIRGRCPRLLFGSALQAPECLWIMVM